MRTSAAVRTEIEAALAQRLPGALSPQVRAERTRLSSGLAAVDAVTRGGFPAGAITEIGGAECSGRTTLAMSFLAKRVLDGMVFAWIDVVDGLDPESAAAAGVDLDRMLWVRCGEKRCEAQLVAPVSTGRLGVMIDRNLSAPSLSGGCGSPHPRSEGRGLSEAIGGLMGGLALELMGTESYATAGRQSGDNRALLPVKRKDRSIGTPSAPNRAVAEAPRSALSWRSVDRVEQVPTDRLPARRGNIAISPQTGPTQPRSANAQPGWRPQNHLSVGTAAAPLPRALDQRKTDAGGEVKSGGRTAPKHRPWSALDQSLRATDMLLQAGGFGVVVLDLGGVAPEVVWRIPMATWFRFRAAADRSRACLVVLTQRPCARSSAELVLEMEPGVMKASGRVMTGVAYEAKVGRQRFVTEEIPKVVSIRETVREADADADLDIGAMPVMSRNGVRNGADRGDRRPPEPERTGAWYGTSAWAQTSGVDGVRPARGESRLRGSKRRTG